MFHRELYLPVDWRKPGETRMKNNHKLGIVLAVLGILTGLLTLYLLAQQYNLLI